MVNMKNRQAGKIGFKKSQGAVSKKIKIFFIVPGVIAVFAIVVLILSYAFVYGGHVKIMEVNGQPVTREEFKFYLDKEKSSVTSYFYENYGVSANEQFWTKTYGGQRPRDVLKDKAREACIYDKTLQGLALQYGLAKDTSFSGFLSQWKEINKERKVSAGRGETLYGVVQFTELQYYLNMMSTLKSSLRDKLENTGIFVKDEEVLAKYNERYDTYNNSNNITIAELHIPYIADFMSKDSIDPEIKARPVNEAYDLISQIKQQLDAGGDFDKLCETNTGEKPVEMTYFV